MDSTISSSWKDSIVKVLVVAGDWDDPIPEELVKPCREFLQQIRLTSTILVKRWVGYDPDLIDLELRAFGDASIEAYGAVVCLRCTLPDGRIKVLLMYARARVAPLKTLSVPRLELCAAVLLSEAVQYVKRLFRLPTVSIVC